MKKILCLGILFAVLTGCKSPVPKDIIPPEKMQKILFDIHMVDGYINLMPQQDSAKKIAAAYYRGVYNKFGIDSVLYTKSMDFYYKNPEIMGDMYTKIQADLKKTKEKTEKDIAKALEKATKKIKDSIKADSVLKSKLDKKGKDSLLKVKRLDSLLKIKKTDSLRKITKADSLLKVKKADSILRTKKLKIRRMRVPVVKEVIQ